MVFAQMHVHVWQWNGKVLGRDDEVNTTQHSINIKRNGICHNNTNMAVFLGSGRFQGAVCF